MIVGNKNDLVDQRMVTVEDGMNFAKKHGAYFMETSAMLNAEKNVNKAFH